MGKGRRVILFLVEGPSDETALVRPFCSILAGNQELGDKIESEEFHCDVTTVRLFPNKTSFKVYRRPQDTVRGFILDRIELRHAYAWDDLERIIHIVDLDGAFVPDECIVLGREERYLYFDDHIEVPNVAAAIRRNREKADVLRELASCHALTYRGQLVPYGAYFVSRNLEHALYGICSELSDEEKKRLSFAFAEKYRNAPKDFVNLLKSKDVMVSGKDLQTTWDYVQKEDNSLRRGSNLHLLLNDYIKSDS